MINKMNKLERQMMKLALRKFEKEVKAEMKRRKKD